MQPQRRHHQPRQEQKPACQEKGRAYPVHADDETCQVHDSHVGDVHQRVKEEANGDDDKAAETQACFDGRIRAFSARATGPQSPAGSASAKAIQVSAVVVTSYQLRSRGPAATGDQ